MQTVTIDRGPVTFPAGTRLKLSDDQVRRRRRLVEPAGASGVFLALAPVQFKTGETVQTDADIPKGWTDRVSISGAKKTRRREEDPPTDKLSGDQ